MKHPHELKHLFSDKSFVGDILRWAVVLESELDTSLCQYFIVKSRAEQALEKLMPAINFNAKIEILADLPIRKNTQSYRNSIEGLRVFRKLRNIVAHNGLVTSHETIRLCNNQLIASMLNGYPSITQQVFRRSAKAIARLRRTREFLYEDGTSLDHFMIVFRKMCE